MKLIATYLPQFHRVKENDEWWGEGFTDWVATRDAEKMFPGHREPRVPLNENYYDLNDKNTMRWQERLMHQYDVDGMCFYHYYFADGRKILEGPAENLLRWKEINMPFCFCWDNESWVRSWSKVFGSNSWADRYDKNAERGDDEYLLKQDYGNEREWEAHFDYLLPFFQDDRYIKIDNRPVFWIFSVHTMPCVGKMVGCWRELAKRAGFDDIYFVGTWCEQNNEEYFDAVMTQQPIQTLLRMRSTVNKGEDLPYIMDYDVVWKDVLEARKIGKATCYEGFVDFDDTPRRGKNGTVVYGATPEKFRSYLTELLAKSSAYGADMVFLSAWNEWGEGMYLEPDDENGYQYLEAIPYAKTHYREKVKKYNDQMALKLDIEKLNLYLDLFEEWMSLCRKGISVSGQLVKDGINTVAIYGYSRFGRQLLDELASGDITVSYIIDEKVRHTDADVPIYAPDDFLPDCDAVIVSAPYYFEEIKTKIADRFRVVVSLADLIMTCNVNFPDN